MHWQQLILIQMLIEVTDNTEEKVTDNTFSSQSMVMAASYS